MYYEGQTIRGAAILKFRIIDITLLVATIAGAVIAIRSGRTLHALQTDHTRLSRTVGGLAVTDPALLHVQAFETGEPFHFAWRVYIPAGQLVASAAGAGGSSRSTSSYSEPREFLARVRLSQSRTGQIAVYYNFGSGSGYRTIGSVDAFEYLQEHRDELQIKQLGAGGTVRAKRGESIELLHISLPQSPASEGSNPSDDKSLHLDPEIFECRLELSP